MSTDSPHPDSGEGGDPEHTIYGDSPGSEPGTVEPDVEAAEVNEEPDEDVNPTIYHESAETDS